MSQKGTVPDGTQKPSSRKDPAAVYCIIVALLLVILATGTVIAAFFLRVGKGNAPKAGDTPPSTVSTAVHLPNADTYTKSTARPSPRTAPTTTSQRTTKTMTTTFPVEKHTDEPTSEDTTSEEATTWTRPAAKRTTTKRTTTTRSSVATTQPQCSTVIKKPTQFCQTADCQHITYLFNISVGGPCRNMCSYMCSSGRIDVIREMFLNVTEKMFITFTTLIPSVSRHSSTEKALVLYQSCTARKGQRPDTKRVLLSFMRENGLSFQEDSRTGPLDMTLRLLLRYGVHIFFEFAVDNLFLHSDEYAVLMKESSDFILARKALAKWRDHSKFDFYVTGVLGVLDLMDNQTIYSTARKVISITSNIFSIGVENDFKTSGLEPLRVVLNDTRLNIRWASSLATHSGQHLPGNYMYSFLIFIRSFTNGVFVRVSASDLNLYIAWEVTRQLVTLTYLRKVFTDNTPLCYPTAKKLMKHAVRSPYLMFVVNISILQEVATIVINIKTKVEENTRNSWLEGTTKCVLLMKLRDMRFQVGYPKGLRTRHDVDAFYSSYPLVRGPLLQVYLNTTAAKANSFYNELARRPADPLYLDSDYERIIPFYRNNVVFLPAGTLISPGYNYGAPPEINYGTTGYMDAHEMMYGYDYEGRLKDEHG